MGWDKKKCTPHIFYTRMKLRDIISTQVKFWAVDPDVWALLLHVHDAPCMRAAKIRKGSQLRLTRLSFHDTRLPSPPYTSSPWRRQRGKTVALGLNRAWETCVFESAHLRGTARDWLKKREAANERFISLSHAPQDRSLSVAILKMWNTMTREMEWQRKD